MPRVDVLFGNQPPCDARAATNSTYVDDQAFLVDASCPRELDRRIDCLLAALIQIMSKHGLKLNFKEGKTEAFLVYMGRHAPVFYKRRQEACAGYFCVLPPGAPTERLRVVGKYRHLGSVVHARGSILDEVAARASAGIAATSALSKVWSNRDLPEHIRVSVYKACVLSRLVYNAHIWASGVGPRRWARLEAVQMRVLRRIAGEVGNDKKHPATNGEVRRMLGVLPVEMIVWQRRMCYLPQLLRGGPSSLHALLALRKGHIRMPWVKLVLGDIELLRSWSSNLSEFPSPLEDPDVWTKFAAEFPRQWKQIVKKCFSYGATSDPSNADTEVAAPPPVCAFACLVCGKAFPSGKSLQLHTRHAHGTKCDWTYYVGSQSCPCCGREFANRLRVFKHLSDSKQGMQGCRCAKYVLSSAAPRLPSPQRILFEEEDRVERRKVRARY